LRFFKDELNGKLMKEFEGLCSKVYCYRTDQVYRFPRINFTQEKVLITGPAIDHILKEVNLQQILKDEKN